MRIKKTGSNHEKIIADCKMRRLENLLNRYHIPPVSDQLIDRTVEGLRQYVPVKQNQWERQAEKLADILNAARQDAPFFSWGYWLACLLFFAAGYWIIAVAKANAYTIVLLIAPLPFILGLLELFKGREAGMAELELTCKLSIRELILARVVIIGAYSILLNTLLSVFIYYSQPSAYLWQLTLFWLTPFTSISAMSLYIVQKVRSGYAATFFLTTWAAAVFIMQTTGFTIILQTANTLAYLLIIIFSALVLTYETQKMTDKYFLLTTERWSRYGFNS